MAAAARWPASAIARPTAANRVVGARPGVGPFGGGRSAGSVCRRRRGSRGPSAGRVLTGGPPGCPGAGDPARGGGRRVRTGRGGARRGGGGRSGRAVGGGARARRRHVTVVPSVRIGPRRRLVGRPCPVGRLIEDPAVARAAGPGLVLGTMLARVRVFLRVDRPVRAARRPVPRRAAPTRLEWFLVGAFVGGRPGPRLRRPPATCTRRGARCPRRAAARRSASCCAWGRAAPWAGPGGAARSG